MREVVEADRGNTVGFEQGEEAEVEGVDEAVEKSHESAMMAEVAGVAEV